MDQDVRNEMRGCRGRRDGKKGGEKFEEGNQLRIAGQREEDESTSQSVRAGGRGFLGRQVNEFVLDVASGAAGFQHYLHCTVEFDTIELLRNNSARARTLVLFPQGFSHQLACMALFFPSSRDVCWDQATHAGEMRPILKRFS